MSTKSGPHGQRKSTETVNFGIGLFNKVYHIHSQWLPGILENSQILTVWGS